MANIWVLTFFTVVGATQILLFLERRFSWWRTCLAVYGAAALATLVDVLLWHGVGMDCVIRLYPLTSHVPIMLASACVSRVQGWRLMFQLLSAVQFAQVIHHVGSLVYYLSGRRVWVLVLSYGLLTAGLILFILCLLRPLYLRVMRQIRHGWWLVCLVMAAHYLINIYLVPGYAGMSEESTLLKAAITLMMVGFYVVLIFLFYSVQGEMEAQHNAEMSALQVSALCARMEALHEAEQAVRLERHDLRHRLHTAAELVRTGRGEEALDFLGAAQARLDEGRPVRWCRAPVLDAVFSAYFRQAEREGARVEAEITLPDRLPVEEAELGMVFANALENSIHACQALPLEERMIRCKAIGYPGLMLEVGNPCARPVQLDERGLPVSGEKGHGLGTRSILSFCRKYGALCQYEFRDSWLFLRIIF